ncbi:nucleoside/nucleotide kinase family protein [Microtetraspora malaysiensis]|uniref:Guanylate kinase n=1 Tax=Microtetraspora malaysiensis TaxID=161358 RepID=A0ABW6T1E0_9ACTN
MRPRGIVLYGPPASGKSTITAALADTDPQFTLLRKLKVGTGRTDEYDFVTAEHLEQLREAGRLLVETRRYGNTYAVDACTVEAMAEADQIPIVHVGSVADLHQLTDSGGDWLRVRLWVPRELCEQRSQSRGDTDTDKRLQAWDEAQTDLNVHAETATFDLSISTQDAEAVVVAREIAGAFAALAAEGEGAGRSVIGCDRAGCWSTAVGRGQSGAIRSR